MAVYTAEAVVLRKLDYGEADRILTLFTLERGKLSAIAKGIRKSKSRMSGQLDVFAHGRMMLAEGRNLDVVTQFQRIGTQGHIGDDLRRAAAAGVVAEVADKVLEERHPQPELFAVVVEGLGRLAAGDAEPRMEAVFFLMRLLVELGYAPELAVCARCGGPLGEAALGFSALAGGVVCGDCAAAHPSSSISARQVKILRVCAAGDRDLFFRLRLEEDDLGGLETALENQLEHHLDRQLKSIDFARRVRRQGQR